MTDTPYSSHEERFLHEAAKANLSRLQAAVRILTVGVFAMVLLMAVEIIVFIVPDPRDGRGWSTLSSTMAATTILFGMRAYLGLRFQAISILRKGGLVRTAAS